MAIIISCLACGGCFSSSDRGSGHLEAIWGRRGISDGRLKKPRALAINDRDEIFVVDMTARIQVFDRDGTYLRGWRMPSWENGKPTGLSIDRAGNLLVADTHYYRVLVFDPSGKRLEDRTLGGTQGHQPGEFGLVTDAVQDSQGNSYVAEYGEYDRVQKFSADGKFLLQWGGHGDKPGEFVRPQNLAIDQLDHVWVADACNHRVQVFDATGNEAQLLRYWGEEGTEPGQLLYPYDLVLDGEGHLFVCEFGNHRVQKFTLDGQLVSYWGNVGRQPGELHNPWAIVQDSRGRIHVLDTYNHRVQRVRL
jgi:DNA-binding beta-propeller fold protein YncE